MSECSFPLGWRRIRGGPASGSAIFDRVDPAGNLELLTRQLRTPEEVPDGQR
jgi:hypothetical protein